MTDTPTSHPRLSISGRLFVIPFVVVLAFLLWLVFSMATRFQTIMQQLELTRAAWPQASTAYLSRLDVVEPVSAELGSDWKEQFDSLRLKCENSTQFDQQSPTIFDLHRLLKSKSEKLSSIVPKDTNETMREVERLEQARRGLQSDFVGQCTVNGLRLKLPPIFSLER